MTTKFHSGALRLICILSLIFPAAALPWNQATHAYIAERIGERVGLERLEVMWGSVAPDLINFIFDPAVCPGWVADQTHGIGSESFLEVWKAATTGPEKALAYGFVTHNQAWGADNTAHVSGRTFGQDVGYVIAKAAALLRTSSSQSDPRQTFEEAFRELGISSPDARAAVAHVVTEYAIDIRLRNDVDSLIGRKLAAAARGETKRFPDLLVKAFAADYAAVCFGGDVSKAAQVLTDVEREHRTTMIYLGQAISRSEPIAVKLSAEQIAAVLPGFLGAPVPEPETVDTLEAAIIGAMSLCDDYRAEIEATIDFVSENLRSKMNAR